MADYKLFDLLSAFYAKEIRVEHVPVEVCNVLCSAELRKPLPMNLSLNAAVLSLPASEPFLKAR